MKARVFTVLWFVLALAFCFWLQSYRAGQEFDRDMEQVARDRAQIAVEAQAYREAHEK